MKIILSIFQRVKMQEVRGGAAFTLFLCCDVPVGVLGAHWDTDGLELARSCWSGAFGYMILGVLLMDCSGELMRSGLWRSSGELADKGRPSAGTSMVTDVLLAPLGLLGVQVSRGQMTSAARTTEGDFPKLIYLHREEKQNRKMWCKISQHICFSSIPLKCSF